MKKLMALILTLLCLWGSAGCTMQSEYAIRIVVPAGSQGEFVYSDEEISPRKSRLEIKSIDMAKDAEFVSSSTNQSQYRTHHRRGNGCGRHRSNHHSLPTQKRKLTKLIGPASQTGMQVQFIDRLMKACLLCGI